MTALYWLDFDCTAESRLIEHIDTIHVHCRTEAEACTEYVRLLACSHADWYAGRRYICLRGPGGLVRGVKGC